MASSNRPARIEREVAKMVARAKKDVAAMVTRAKKGKP